MQTVQLRLLDKKTFVIKLDGCKTSEFNFLLVFTLMPGNNNSKLTRKSSSGKPFCIVQKKKNKRNVKFHLTFNVIMLKQSLS